MIAVDEGKVEAATFGEEAREYDLRFLRVVLHELCDPRLVEELKAAVGEPRCLVRIDDNVTCGGVAVREQAFACEQRRDAISEADLDGVRRVFPFHPLPQGFALGGTDSNREQAVGGAVRSRHGSTLTQQAVDHLSCTLR